MEKSGVKWCHELKSGDLSVNLVEGGPEPGQLARSEQGEEAPAMFLGTHEPKLDEKGRIILPARFRDELAKGLVITKGQERCLYVFPINEFSAITDRLRQAPVTEKAARDYMRVMFAGAHDEVPDKQGRVSIPGGLRTYAGLEKECVVIGANTRLEIWDFTAWNTYLADREKGFADVSTEVLPGLF